MHEVNLGHQWQLLLWWQIIPRKSVDTVRIRNVLHYIFSDARIRKENQASLYAICSFNFFTTVHQLIKRSAVQLVIASDTSVFQRQDRFGYPDNSVDRRKCLTKEWWIHLPAEHKCSCSGLQPTSYVGRPPTVIYLDTCLDWNLDSAWFWGSDYSVSGPRNLARFTADVSGLRSLARYRLYSDRVATRQPMARANLGPTLH